MKRIPFLFVVLVFACQPTDSTTEAWQGEWTARWKTDPAGYGALAAEMSFEMNGKFTFDGDQATISAYGYEGCIFNVDTLEHTLIWTLRSDTLELQNQPGEPGIQYKVLEQSEKQIRLQLVDDIFITLTK
ncbi:MAG: hypothetical protein RIF46_07120 [Cyclobacteriaceae bacterium]